MRFLINPMLIIAMLAIAFVPLYAYNGEVVFDQLNEGHQFQLVRGVFDTDYDFYVDSQFVFSASVHETDSTIQFINAQTYTPVMLWQKFMASGMTQVNFDSLGDTAKTISIADTSFTYKMADAIWNDYSKLRAHRVIFDQKDEAGNAYRVSRSYDLYDYEFYVGESYMFSAELDPVDSRISLYESGALDPADDILLMDWHNLGETGMTQVNYSDYGTFTDSVIVKNTELYYKIAKAMWADYRKKR